jgi:hypothetical protein
VGNLPAANFSASTKALIRETEASKGSPVYRFKALLRLVEDGGRSVGKKENILFIISVVLLHNSSEIGENIKIV